MKSVYRCSDFLIESFQLPNNCLIKSKLNKGFSYQEALHQECALGDSAVVNCMSYSWSNGFKLQKVSAVFHQM